MPQHPTNKMNIYILINYTHWTLYPLYIIANINIHTVYCIILSPAGKELRVQESLSV